VGPRNLADPVPITKVLSKDAADKTVEGPYRPDVVRGSVARARDADQLRTPQQLRDGLGLDDSPSAAAGHPWSPIPDNAEYAYQLRWQAERGPENMEIPYGPLPALTPAMLRTRSEAHSSDKIPPSPEPPQHPVASLNGLRGTLRSASRRRSGGSTTTATGSTPLSPKS
jgi:hypothetical protein